MFKEEVIIKIIDKIDTFYPDMFDRQKIKLILEEVLYDYQVNIAEKSLVIRNNIIDKALLYIAAKKIDGLAGNSLRGYARHLKHFSSNINKNIEDINAMDIRIYLANYSNRGVKNSTLSTKISVLKSFFNWLENEEYISKNPMKKIKSIKKQKSLREPLTADELELMRDACKTLRQRALLELFYATGCRLSEIVRLNKEDINWQKMNIKVLGKGNKERFVYINAKVKLYLKKYLLGRSDDREALFVTERKPYRRVSNRCIQREIKKIGKLAGLKKNIFPHLLRYSTATRLINNGADIATVQCVLGHSTPSTTMIYAKISNENVEYEYRKHMLQ